MWQYTKCTAVDREAKLQALKEAFREEKDCSKYLAEVQKYISSTQTTVVLLQDTEDNILIEMDYVPVNDYIFRVVSIEDNGIKKQGMLCKSIEQAVGQFVKRVEEKWSMPR